MNYTFEKLRDIIECFDPCMDNYLYVYYNTELIVIHPVSAKKLNYTHDHYVAISKQTFKEQTMDIEKIAKENLTQIGAMFKNE